MKPGGARAKGIAFEKEIAQALRAVFPGARRGLGQERAGHEAADVEGTPYWIQAKHGQRPNIEAAYEQAVRDQKASGKIRRSVVVVTRRNRGRTLVTMDLDDWVWLCDSVPLSERYDDYEDGGP